MAAGLVSSALQSGPVTGRLKAVMAPKTLVRDL